MTDPTEQQLRELFASQAAGAPSAGGLAALTLHRVRHRRRVRRTVASGLIAAAAVAGGVAAIQQSAGPGAGPGSSPAADCSFGVSFEGTQFVGELVVPLPADPVQQLGEAEVGECTDTSPLPSDVTADEEAERITVSTYPGYDPRQVLTVPDLDDGLRVLVSADLPREERLRILAALQLAGADEQPTDGGPTD